MGIVIDVRTRCTYTTRREFMKKKKYKCRYDDKTGMTVLRALFGYCVVAAVIVNVVLASSIPKAAMEGLLIASSIFIGLDLFVRILHFRERRRSENLLSDIDEIRYISFLEKITYWILKIVIPIYILALLVASALLGI